MEWEELRELEERRKRKSSLVIRGLQVSSPAEAAAKFGEVSQALIGERATLSEVCQIKRETDIFRGNLHDNRLRKLILEHARNLNNSPFSSVYIRRDLTFAQSEELRARYLSRLQQPRYQIGDSALGTPTPEPRTNPYHETIPKRAQGPPAFSDPRDWDQYGATPAGSHQSTSLGQRETEVMRQSPAQSTETEGHADSALERQGGNQGN